MDVIKYGNLYKKEKKAKDNYPIVHPELLSAAKKKADRICLWCGGELENDNESFCSVYCAGMWNGEGD